MFQSQISNSEGMNMIYVFSQLFAQWLILKPLNDDYEDICDMIVIGKRNTLCVCQHYNCLKSRRGKGKVHSSPCSYDCEERLVKGSMVGWGWNPVSSSQVTVNPRIRRRVEKEWIKCAESTLDLWIQKQKSC